MTISPSWGVPWMQLKKKTCNFVERSSFHSQNYVIPPFPLKLSVTDDGLTTETGIIIKMNLIEVDYGGR